MAEVILIAAPFLIVPLGLWHLDREGVAGTGLRRQGLVYFASWCSAILLAISLLLPTGTWAGLLAIPWMLFTYILAGIGLVHFFRHVRSLNEQLCYSAALVYVAVGGTWAMVSRSGMQVMDFEPTIVLLTAVHFHYAGFALPLLSGLAIRTMTRHHLARLMILLIIVGIPLVGVGIAGDPLVEIIAVGILTAGCVGLALVQLVTPVTPVDRLKRLCSASRGFVYAVTMTGITGGRVELPNSVRSYLDRARAVSQTPLLAGFGIRSADQVRELAAHSDGVIVGSALVECIERGEDPAEFLRTLISDPKEAA